MFRVETVSSDPDLLVSAFTGLMGETVVLVNRSQHEIYCSISAGMEAFRYLEYTSQYYQNQVVILPEMNENVFEQKILPGEIITLSSVKINN